MKWRSFVGHALACGVVYWFKSSPYMGKIRLTFVFKSQDIAIQFSESVSIPVYCDRFQYPINGHSWYCRLTL